MTADREAREAGPAAVVAPYQALMHAQPAATVYTPPPVAYFAKLPAGWRELRGGRNAVALSWKYRTSPFGWGNAMPRNAIAVQVFFPPGPTARYPPLKLVLPRSPAATLEGAPETPEYRIHGRVRGRNVEVWVDIR